MFPLWTIAGRRWWGGLLSLGLILSLGCHKMGALQSDEIRVTGTVQRIGVEGGCWVLEASDGTRYELRPAQAPPEVLRDGARAVLVLKKRIDLMSICQVGQIVDVQRVESIEG